VNYIENPKTKDSGIICAIPQAGRCPVGCRDCWFQTGRSYLEPLDKNLPNLPPVELTTGFVVRLNDGNDSNNQRELVEEASKMYQDAFFNTSMTDRLSFYPGPVVLTVNPGQMTDNRAHLILQPPGNLMFVRFRANTWNKDLLDQVVKHYTPLGVPVVLTFMAYYEDDIPEAHKHNYEWRQRTMNSYWVIRPGAWACVKAPYYDNALIHTCGKNPYDFKCANCGNCIREYFVTKTRMR
jgi:hypothetical protein